MIQSGIQACDPTSALMASHNLWKHLLSSVAAPGCAGEALSGNSPTSNHRYQPREGLIAQGSHLALHLHSRSKGDPYKSPSLLQALRLAAESMRETPRCPKHKTSFLYPLCAAAGLKEREIPAIVKSQMMTVQQWCQNLYKSLTLYFNQYKLKIAKQCDLDEC